MARSIVLYLMLLHLQTVFRPRIAGCSGWESSIVGEANTRWLNELPSGALRSGARSEMDLARQWRASGMNRREWGDAADGLAATVAANASSPSDVA